MGATTEFYKVKCVRSELNNTANDLRDQAKYDHGHSGYTGTIAEDNGKLTILSEAMTTEDAYNYINDNARKWENSIAVPIKDTENEWLIGGLYSC